MIKCDTLYISIFVHFKTTRMFMWKQFPYFFLIGYHIRLKVVLKSDFCLKLCPFNIKFYQQIHQTLYIIAT